MIKLEKNTNTGTNSLKIVHWAVREKGLIASKT